MPAVFRDLYGAVFRSAIFPALDLLNRTDIVSKLEELLESEGLHRRLIEDRQQEKLERTVARARRTSSFYRRFWSSTRHQPQRLPSTYPQLDGLPVVTKADLRAARDLFPEPEFRRRVVAAPTSGSTGAPMIFYRSLEQESWFWALRFRMWAWAGYRPGDPYLTINLNPREAWRKKLQDILFRCAYLTFNADDLDSLRVLDTLRRRRIAHLNGFSSSLFVLAQFMNEHDIPNPGVTGITSTGDGLFSPYRESIERAFGVRVLDYYGAGGEGVHVASQCLQSGHRYHIHPENVALEILGPEGPAASGETGRVVVTQLDNDAMPLIRYEVGDVAKMADSQLTCSCGRTLPMLEGIEGRIPDLILVPGGTYLVPHFFVVLFKQLQDVHRYQIVQSCRESITVRLVPRVGCVRRQVARQVTHAVERATSGRLTVQIDWVDEIPLSGAGKRRLVISKLARDSLMSASAHRAESSSSMLRLSREGG